MIDLHLEMYRERQALLEKIDNLKEEIRNQIDYKENNPEKDAKTNAWFIQQYKELLEKLEKPIYSMETYENIEWLYNYGNLRTENEIYEREEDKKNAQYVNSGRYQESCFIRKLGWGVGGFILGFIMPFAFWESTRHLYFFLFVGWMLSGFFGCLFSLIGIGIATHLNLEDAREHKVHPSHPRYAHDRREKSILGIAGILAASSILRHTYKSAKDVGNVDSWKNMK